MKFEPNKTPMTFGPGDQIYAIWHADTNTFSVHKTAKEDAAKSEPASPSAPEIAEDLAASTLRDICEHVKMGDNGLLSLPSEQWVQLRRLVGHRDAAVGQKAEPQKVEYHAYCPASQVTSFHSTRSEAEAGCGCRRLHGGTQCRIYMSAPPNDAMLAPRHISRPAWVNDCGSDYGMLLVYSSEADAVAEAKCLALKRIAVPCRLEEVVL